MIAGSRLAQWSTSSSKPGAKTFAVMDKQPKMHFDQHHPDAQMRSEMAVSGGGAGKKKTVSKAAVRERLQAEAAAARQKEKDVHAQFKADGVVMPPKFPQGEHERGWRAGHGENAANGFSRKVQAGARGGVRAAKQARLEAELKAKADAAPEPLSPAEERLANAIQQQDLEKLVDPKLRAKLPKLLNAPAGAESAKPDLMKSHRRLSMATVVKISMMGIKAKKRVKAKQRERTSAMREHNEKMALAKTALDERMRAEGVRKEIRARHQAAFDALEKKRVDGQLRLKLFHQGDFRGAAAGGQELKEGQMSTPRKGGGSKHHRKHGGGGDEGGTPRRGKVKGSGKVTPSRS